MVLYRGIKDEFFGTLKEYIGWAIGNEKLETNGKKEKSIGKAELEPFFSKITWSKRDFEEELWMSSNDV